MVSKYEITDPDLLKIIKDLQDRVSKLERTPQLLNSSVDARGIDVFGGGEIRIHDGSIKIMDANDVVRVQLGHLADGSYDMAAFNPNYNALGVLTSTTQVDLGTLAFGMAGQFNTHTGTTSSPNSYTDLDNVTGPGDDNYGPEVTVNIGNAGRAVVMIAAQMQSTPTGNTGAKCAMSFAVSGATTSAPTDERGLIFYQQISNVSDPIDFNNYIDRASYAHVMTGLNAGLNTFTAKYSSGGSGTQASFQDRTIIVMPF